MCPKQNEDWNVHSINKGKKALSCILNQKCPSNCPKGKELKDKNPGKRAQQTLNYNEQSFGKFLILSLQVLDRVFGYRVSEE
jgi:hypothetical protein